jgi:GcrA cell cycle regulator
VRKATPSPEAEAPKPAPVQHSAPAPVRAAPPAAAPAPSFAAPAADAPPAAPQPRIISVGPGGFLSGPGRPAGSHPACSAAPLGAC